VIVEVSARYPLYHAGSHRQQGVPPICEPQAAGSRAQRNQSVMGKKLHAQYAMTAIAGQ
jgi:hypothetical protein